MWECTNTIRKFVQRNSKQCAIEKHQEQLGRDTKLQNEAQKIRGRCRTGKPLTISRCTATISPDHASSRRSTNTRSSTHTHTRWHTACSTVRLQNSPPYTSKGQHADCQTPALRTNDSTQAHNKPRNKFATSFAMRTAESRRHTCTPEGWADRKRRETVRRAKWNRARNVEGRVLQRDAVK